jgi:hypothetical protein
MTCNRPQMARLPTRVLMAPAAFEDKSILGKVKPSHLGIIANAFAMPLEFLSLTEEFSASLHCPEEAVIRHRNWVAAVIYSEQHKYKRQR